MENSIINPLQHYYEKQETATRECLLALKSIVLSVDENIVYKRKYQIPFFCYNELNLGFLWVHRKKIIVGFVEDKRFSSFNVERKKHSITTLEVNPLDDIPVDEIKQAFRQLITKYKH
ncbi:DUF1801 domain-containing protein [Chitinophaga sp. MM2321]|uniref:DUF1801 domain-containing protein n=1 Tax=Chitinophaga sp. MM2321 TaxID=3137178 RepID=UPI0032D588D4